MPHALQICRGIRVSGWPVSIASRFCSFSSSLLLRVDEGTSYWKTHTINRSFCTTYPPPHEGALRSLTWETVLSPENRAQCVEKMSNLPSFRKASSAANSQKLGSNYSAVLVPLCHVEGELSLLYTVRTSDLRSHRREVSFPGGKADPEDETSVDTALRETEEEIGIGREWVDVWGTMPPQPSKEGNSFVIGVLGYAGNLDEKSFTINHSEVDTVFAVSLRNLCDPANCRQTQFRSKHFRGGYTLPIFIGSEPKVWGFTAIITHLTLTSLLPDIYQHKIYHTRF